MFVKNTIVMTIAERLAIQSAQKNLSIEGFRGFIVHYPESTRKQKSIVDNLELLRMNILTIKSKISSSQSLQKSLINQIFSS